MRADHYDVMAAGCFQPYVTRGTALLLAHCHAPLDERPSAFERLRAELGDGLARVLVCALAGPQGRRGSSSP